MNRVSNLYDLHKIREAIIEENNKVLAVNYEMGSALLSSKKKEVVSQKRSFNLNCFGGEVFIDFKSSKLNLIVCLDEPDKNKLYQIFLVIAYLLGDNIVLKHSYEEFPFYPIPKGYNMGGYPFAFVNRERLLLDPVKFIGRGVKLINDPESFFSKILVTLLQINNLDLFDIRFFGEFVLLEYLSRKCQVGGTILDAESNAVACEQLNFILDGLAQKIDKEPSLEGWQKEALKKKFLFKCVNSKGALKEKINVFIDSLGEEFEDFKQYVGQWNFLRNRKGIAHGALMSSKNKLDEKDFFLMKKLHELLCGILYKEFCLGRAYFDDPVS